MFKLKQIPMYHKKFIYGVILCSAALILNSCQESREIKYDFCHHVYFWLNNPDDKADREAFEKGVEELLNIPEIKLFHIGVPVAETAGREVVDDTYTYSYMVFFNDPDGHDIYQDHPLHLKFIEECQHLWNRVLVYDSVVK